MPQLMPLFWIVSGGMMLLMVLVGSNIYGGGVLSVKEGVNYNLSQIKMKWCW